MPGRRKPKDDAAAVVPIKVAKSTGKPRKTRVPPMPSAVAAREQTAMRMLILGATYDQIAAEIDLTVSGTRQLVRRVLRSRADEHKLDVESYRQLVSDRLELLMAAWMPRAYGVPATEKTSAIAPNDKAAMVLLRAIDSFTALHNLAKAGPPVDLRPTGPTADELADRRARIAAELTDAIDRRKQAIEGVFFETEQQA